MLKDLFGLYEKMGEGVKGVKISFDLGKWEHGPTAQTSPLLLSLLIYLELQNITKEKRESLFTDERKRVSSLIETLTAMANGRKKRGTEREGGFRKENNKKMNCLMNSARHKCLNTVAFFYFAYSLAHPLGAIFGVY